MARERTEARSGFTLIEALAMLALTSVIMVGMTALIHDVAKNFDRGTRGVTAGERLLLAVERLAQDFGSARYVVWNSKNGPAVAFMAESNDDGLAKVVFVANAGVMSGPQGDEVITLTVERDDSVTRLVRRRTQWMGSRMHAEDAIPADPVVLIEGKVDIALQFAGIGPNGALQWSGSWTGAQALPRFVRLFVRDRASGRDLLGESDFVVRADAPAACGRPDASPGCLYLALSDTPTSSGPTRNAQ
jgi:type II secretory pathway component PulJ